MYQSKVVTLRINFQFILLHTLNALNLKQLRGIIFIMLYVLCISQHRRQNMKIICCEILENDMLSHGDYNLSLEMM